MTIHTPHRLCTHEQSGVCVPTIDTELSLTRSSSHPYNHTSSCTHTHTHTPSHVRVLEQIPDDPRSTDDGDGDWVAESLLTVPAAEFAPINAGICANFDKMVFTRASCNESSQFLTLDQK